MKFGSNAGKTMAVFSNNTGLIMKISALSFLISFLSLGFLIPVMLAGMGTVFLKLNRGEKPGTADLFTRADKTLRLFALGLIIMLVSLSGIVFIFLPVLILAVWMYAVFFMAFENKGIAESLSLSANAVVKNNFFTHIIAALVLCILNAVGAALFFVGLIVTLPLTAGFLAFCYMDLKSNV